jgi:spermidine synthase
MLGKRGLTGIAWCLGFLSTTAQVVVLRELLVAFTGNELTIASTLAIWLLSVAGGCHIIKRISRADTPAAAGVLFIIAALAFAFQVVLIRVATPVAGSLGEIMSPPAVLWLSASGISAGAAVIGGLFVVLVRLAERSGHRGAIPTIYGFEAVGSAAAGALLSFYLLEAANAYVLVGLAAIVSLLCGAYLLAKAGLGRPHWGGL